MTPKDTAATARKIIQSVMYALEEPTPLSDFSAMLLRHLTTIQEELSWMGDLKQPSRTSASISVLPHVSSILEKKGELEIQGLLRQLSGPDAAAALRLCLSLPDRGIAAQRDYLEHKLQEIISEPASVTQPGAQPVAQPPVTTSFIRNPGEAGTPVPTPQNITEDQPNRTVPAPVRTPEQRTTPLEASFGTVSPAKTPATARQAAPDINKESPAEAVKFTAPSENEQPQPTENKPVRSADAKRTENAAPSKPQTHAAPETAAPADETGQQTPRWSQQWDSGSWDSSPHRTQEETWDMLEYIKYLSNNRMINVVAKEIGENHNTLNRILRDGNRAPKVLDRLAAKLRKHLREWRSSRQTALLTAPAITAAQPNTQSKETHTPSVLPATGIQAEQIAQNVKALYRNQEGQTLLTSMLSDSRHIAGTQTIRQILKSGGLMIREADEVLRLNSEARTLELPAPVTQAALRILMAPLGSEYGIYAGKFALPTAGRRLRDRAEQIRQDYVHLMSKTPISREAIEYAAQTEQIELPSSLLSRLFNGQRISPEEAEKLETLRSTFHNDKIQELREWSFERSADSDHLNPLNRAWFSLAQEAVKAVSGRIGGVKDALDENELHGLNILTGEQPAPRGRLGVTPRVARKIMHTAQEIHLKDTNLWNR